MAKDMKNAKKETESKEKVMNCYPNKNIMKNEGEKKNWKAKKRLLKFLLNENIAEKKLSGLSIVSCILDFNSFCYLN